VEGAARQINHVFASHQRPRARSITASPMSLEKNSTGMPEVNVHKRTTKVNLSMIVGVALFFAVMAGVVLWLHSTS
jgi:hypothetical protein